MQPAPRILATIRAERDALDAVQGSLDQNRLTRAVGFLATCPGKVAVTGMGKIGYVGARFAMTLASTGTPAFFLHPGEALHGDLGMLSPWDLLVACSHSGKTREVIETVTQARGTFSQLRIIAVTAQADSALADQADLELTYGIVPEACPLHLTPTASMAVVGALLDGLALATMEYKGFTRADYAARHHGGYLGQVARKER